MYKEEAPRRIAVLQKGLSEYEHCNHCITRYHHSVNTPVKAQGKVIGYLRGHAFIKTVTGSKHKLRCPPAWAIDAEAFDREVKPNVTELVVIDREAGLEYHCPVEAFDRLKGELDRGFGKQYFLTLSHWNVRGNGHQLNLFEGGDGNAE